METETNYKKLFSLCEHRVDCDALKKEVISKIHAEIAKSEFRYMVMFRGVALLSFVGIIISIRSLFVSLGKTGFYNYISLILSDQSIIVSLWRELTYSIIESLPLIGVIFFLTSVVGFMWFSIKSLQSKNILLTLKA